jgi:hypothetical protein
VESVIAGGRVVDPGTGTDGYFDLLIDTDRIAGTGYGYSSRPKAGGLWAADLDLP